MSTTPGDSTWTDAGLVPPDSPEDLADQEAEVVEIDDLPDELPADAPEADVLDQHLGRGGLPPEPPSQRDDAAEHDVIEQSLDVPDDDADDYPAP